MLDRSTIKTLIRQRLLLNFELQSWYASHYNAPSLDLYILESGQRIPSNQIEYPSIRYKLLTPYIPVNSCDNCDGREEIMFDIYIESREENTNESDELMDIIKNIFFEKCGRGTGIFSQENEDYLLITGGQMQVQTWDVDLVFHDQFNSDPQEGRAGSRTITGVKANGNLVFNVLRFKMPIAEA